MWILARVGQNVRVLSQQRRRSISESLTTTQPNKYGYTGTGRPTNFVLPKIGLARCRWAT